MKLQTGGYSSGSRPNPGTLAVSKTPRTSFRQLSTWALHSSNNHGTEMLRIKLWDIQPPTSFNILNPKVPNMAARAVIRLRALSSPDGEMFRARAFPSCHDGSRWFGDGLGTMNGWFVNGDGLGMVEGYFNSSWKGLVDGFRGPVQGQWMDVLGPFLAYWLTIAWGQCFGLARPGFLAMLQDAKKVWATPSLFKCSSLGDWRSWNLGNSVPSGYVKIAIENGHL